MASQPVGYSGTPLVRKLGIEAGQAVVLDGDVPDGFLGAVLSLPEGVDLLGLRARGPIDVALLFVRRRADLARRLPGLLHRLAPDGAVWVCWPKRASKVPTDMTEDVVRAIGLPLGVVDNKVAAIDQTWSGLRLVVRRENRSAWPLQQD